MVQEIIVAIIGLIVAGIIIQRVYSFFFSKKPKAGVYGCSSCHCNTTKR